MPSAFRHRKLMKEVPHSIPDLFSENVHELGKIIFNYSSSALTPNAEPKLRLEAEAKHERTLYAVSPRPLRCWFLLYVEGLRKTIDAPANS
jgi:hypothetical protein